MRIVSIKIVWFCFFFNSLSGTSQTVQDTLVMNFKEYLGYVKKYHPVAKQANLVLNNAEANLLKSRGGFDPKLEVDYSQKEFKETEYYDILNATFKIPTWFGIELKGKFEQNEGVYLNPERTVPDDGLYSAGISVPVAQGLLINDRMATLKKAKAFEGQSQADRDLLINDILFEASLAYFNWLKAYQERMLFSDFVDNAFQRFQGVKRSAEAGDKAIIDTVEAKIAYQNRNLSLVQADLDLTKARLELSNYLWLGNNIPVELRASVIPDVALENYIDQALQINGRLLSDFDQENHPKLRSLGFKIEGLEIDKRLKANKLLPYIGLEYNFLTETPDVTDSFNTANYKAGLTFNFPLFLRKERGDLRLAKNKLQDVEYERLSTALQLKNKVLAVYAEVESLQDQNDLITNIVQDYVALLNAETRKFSFGESSVFLINSREKSLIDARLKNIQVQIKWLEAKAKLFKTLAINPTDL
ncbi:TolC family protein [Aquimarina brevivitae]|uniref:Outer membrane efflux protein n=1 Tax=Aquimarina brevivitae TaxID=323412 RepID=A0A4Q7PHJ5_9FLAO|nr:TolC family protein [Aquimarina brevivitae]RZT00025.1 outer membrane efflux protein [Aquimarina brevivitae]